MADGNVAFKVTWVYGKDGPFTSPCTPEGRYINIRRQKKVWCSQPECPCNKLFREGNQGLVAVEDDPCYDAMIFTSWSFGGGVYYKGARPGHHIRLNHVRPGKLAFFTSRNIDMPESERIIIGCYEIAGIENGKDGRMVLAKEGSGLRVPDFQNAPRYWDFYFRNNGPRWGTGLFRYLPDRVAQAMYEAVKEATRKG